jgi:predicted MPP superfamily phosphohydrolase
MSLSRLLVFLCVVVGADALMHYALWARLVRDPGFSVGWTRALTIALVLLALLPVAAMTATRLAPRAVVSPLAWVAMTWLGLLFFAVVLLGVVDVGRGALWLVRRTVAAAATAAPLDPGRREAISRLFAGAVATTVLGLGGWSLFEGLRAVALKRVLVPLSKLPRTLSGYKIVQLTDIHVGPTIGREFIEQIVRKTNAASPDLIVITGDLVDGTVEQLGALVEPLRQLRAPDGVFFVTGNHEYYSGADEWIAHLETLGIRVLRNEHLRLRDGGEGGLDLAGVDDWTAKQMLPHHGPDLPKALAGRDEARALVLLAHQPKAIVEAAQRGVDLVLSGHTHGGQLFPFMYLVALQQPYVDGLHRHEGTAIYVSRGTGYWGPPMRLGAPAEITLLELQSLEREPGEGDEAAA